MFSIIDLLKEFILEHNPYFNAGFANVSIDEEQGFVSTQNEVVFPSTSHGDFFYLRYVNPVGLSNATTAFMSEGSYGVGFQITLVLVASVRGADSEILFNNLAATLANYRSQGIREIRFTRASEEPVDIVLGELVNMPEASRKASLSRLDREATLVAIQFTILADLTIQNKLTCIQNPCKPCS